MSSLGGCGYGVAMQPIDFRRGVHGLVALVAQALCADPYGGEIFVFHSWRGRFSAANAFPRASCDSVARMIQMASTGENP